MRNEINIEGKFRFSKFTHLFRTEEKGIAFFNALNRKVVFVNPNNLFGSVLIRVFNNKKEFLISDLGKQVSIGEKEKELVEVLYTKEILVKTNYSEKQKTKILQKKYLDRPAINVLYLILTDRCNFRCSYCFFEEGFPGKTGSLDMNEETARKAIDLYQKNLEKSIKKKLVEPRDASVIFYGGEPLLNAKVLKFAVWYINKLQEENLLPRELLMNINTNGSLLTKDICKLLRKYNIENDISIDGPAEVHNQCRQYPEGRETFDDVIKGFYLSKKEGVKTCISCTIGKHNIEKLSEIFKWFIDELEADAVGFNPLISTSEMQVDELYDREVARTLIECFKIAREKGIYESRMMRKVRAFIEGYTYPFDCCAHGRQLVISPDGKVGVCHAYCSSKRFFTEMRRGFDPYTHQYWQRWSRVSPLNNEECLNCEALTICGGGCPYNAEVTHGDISAIDSSFCFHAKATLKWLIEDLYKKTTKS